MQCWWLISSSRSLVTPAPGQRSAKRGRSNTQGATITRLHLLLLLLPLLPLQIWMSRTWVLKCGPSHTSGGKVARAGRGGGEG